MFKVYLKKILLGCSLFVLAACCCSAPEYAQPDNTFAQRYHNYSMVVKKRCYCQEQWTQAYKIVVRHGQAVSAQNMNTGALVDVSHVGQDIPDLTSVQRLLERAQARSAFVLEVQYNDEFDVPDYVKIDRSENIADDEIEIFISSFTPLSTNH